ncbi:MAG: acyl-CoA dehydrogenase family protein, partial [Chloroflexota bacterium]
ILHAKERKTFGQPLGKWEAISFKIVDDITEVTAARLICYQALRLCDRGLPFTREAAMSKLIGPRIASKVIHDCLLMHGYVGYSDESEFPYRLRQAIGYQIADGTAEAQMIILTREILGREFLPY